MYQKVAGAQQFSHVTDATLFSGTASKEDVSQQFRQSQYKVYHFPFKLQGQNTTFFCNLHQELLPTALMQNSNTSYYVFPSQLRGN